MTERAQALIEMLTLLKENSYSGKLLPGKDFTIIKDCKAVSFDFVLDKVIDYISDQEDVLEKIKKLDDWPENCWNEVLKILGI